MALRALDTEDFNKLKDAFASLAHRPLSDDELMIKDLDTFIRRIPFILPATKMEDLNERKRINDLIATNIIAAA
jgi:Ca2+-binding EF-hand superfamily protein